ncbi:MAG: sugar-binding protein, partial [Rhodothermales bacterium]
CHQRDGNGAPPRYPPLAGTEWVLGDSRRLISVIVTGLEGPIDVNGESYDNVMPQHSFLDDEAVAEVATYIRQNFGNTASAVRADEVRDVRAGRHEVAQTSPQYVVYRTLGTVTIDGRLDEPDWNAAAWTSEFVDIEGGDAPRLRTMAKVLWDDQALYVAAWLEEPDVWATLTQRDAAIYQDNAFEVFVDPDGDTHNYYEIEINALETVWDLILIRPFRDGGPSLSAWDIKGLQARVHVDGTLNNHADTDNGWTVEMALPWAVLREAAPGRRPPRNREQWRLNFARSQWSADVVDDDYRKAVGKPADWWVWSPQGAVDMHRPERFGYVQFTDEEVGRSTIPFVEDPDENVKSSLRELYHLQREYLKAHGRYAEKLADLVDDFALDVDLLSTRSGYEITARGSGGTTVHITQDGRVWTSGR